MEKSPSSPKKETNEVKDQKKGQSTSQTPKPKKEKKAKKTTRAARAFDRLFVKLRVYAPMRVNEKPDFQLYKGDDGKVRNENQSVKLEYGIPEWYSYLNGLKQSPWFKIEVEEVINQEGKEVAKSSIPGELYSDVDKVFAKKKLSASEKEERKRKLQEAMDLLDEED